MKIKNLFASALTALAVMSTPVFANGWIEGGIKAMNEEIAETNFIVNDNCSGTLISADLRLILTNYHCVDTQIKTMTKEVVGVDGEVKTVKYEKKSPVNLSQKVYDGFDVVSLSTLVGDVISYNKEMDLALIQLKVPSIPQTKFAVIYDGDVQRGMEVYTVGNPLMLDATVGKGIISSTTRKIFVGNKEVAYYQTDSVVEGGSSGGSMYTLNGELIGVPGAKYRGTDINMAVPLTNIKQFLDDSGFDVVNGETVEKLIDLSNDMAEEEVTE